MNLGMIAYILSWVTCFSGFFLLPAVVTGLIYREREGLIYLVVALVYIVVGFLLTRLKPRKNRFGAQDGYVTVALTWVLISLLGAVPFTLTGDIPFYVDAVFETVSGFTTTGSTILPDIEALSHCSLLWRCFTHWLGGMGILVFIMAILPLSSGRNIHLMRAESTGPSVEKMVPKVRETAALLYKIYMSLTGAEFLLLLTGGMSPFEALTCAFATAGTGGFAVLNSSMAGYSPYLQYVITLFMLLFGVSFNVYFFLIIRKFKSALLYEEFRWYLIVVAGATALVVYDIRSLFPTLEEAFRQGLFQVASVITTTGYVSTDFDLWPAMAKTVLVLLMFIGACAGSTGGGMKVSRWLVMWKYMKAQISTFRHPRQVKTMWLNGSKIGIDLLRSVLVYLVAYVFIFILSIVIITAEGYDLVTNFTAVATTYNNVGPGLALVGPVCNFSFFSPLSKIVFAFDMLAGRLEVLPLVVLLSAAFEQAGQFFHRFQSRR